MPLLHIQTNLRSSNKRHKFRSSLKGEKGLLKKKLHAHDEEQSFNKINSLGKTIGTKEINFGKIFWNFDI